MGISDHGKQDDSIDPKKETEVPISDVKILNIDFKHIWNLFKHLVNLHSWFISKHPWNLQGLEKDQYFPQIKSHFGGDEKGAGSNFNVDAAGFPIGGQWHGLCS